METTCIIFSQLSCHEKTEINWSSGFLLYYPCLSFVTDGGKDGQTMSNVIIAYWLLTAKATNNYLQFCTYKNLEVGHYEFICHWVMTPWLLNMCLLPCIHKIVSTRFWLFAISVYCNTNSIHFTIQNVKFCC